MFGKTGARRFERGQTAIVTGGGSGIGRALSLALAKRGVRVVVTDMNAASASEVASACGRSAKGHALDVRDAGAVKHLVDSVAREDGRLDYLFNNAGIGVGCETQDLSLEHWDRILDVNVRGVIHGIVAAYPIMLRQRSGHILSVASMAGLGPAPLLTPYAMTKHAVVGLSRSLRIEAAPLGVRVSVLCPGVIETPILDKENPADLPTVGSRPNIRRFLTRLAGPPYPAERLAEETLDAMERDEAVIVIPRRAKIAWKIGTAAPRLVEKVAGAAVAAERADPSYRTT